MTFSEYLIKLYPFYGNGEKEADFVIKILGSATTEQNDKVFDYKPDYIKRIYNGKKDITPTSASYILTHLDKEQFDSEFFNLLSDDALIELCKEFENEIGNATKDDITQKLANLFADIMKCIASKKQIPQTNSNNNFEDEIRLEQSLTQIVNNLSNITQKEIESLISYEPFNVDKKILPENTLLKDDIKSKVVKYYLFIENLFKEASKNNSIFFNNLANAVKFASDNYIINQKLPQPLVFSNMVQWFKTKALSTDDIACQIMVAFFVQNCEVFNEITQ